MAIIRTREGQIYDFKNFTQAINGFITKEGVTTLPAPDVIDQYVPYHEAKESLGKGNRIFSAEESMVLSQLAYGITPKLWTHS